MSTGQLARRPSSSSSSRPANRTTTPISSLRQHNNDSDSLEFEPCAATASILLFAQGSTIVCLHHDTLAVERRFTKHKERVELVAVDNVSERGAGRLVFSYDSDETALVWDLFSGEEIARFSTFQKLKVAAWQKNGNVAFGNGEGKVILFEPSTTEHRSVRTIYDPITALAPAADCQTYAIGYANGSILIAALVPNFTILHTLSTARTPSPIVGLAWHASSSKQKSDMLATQAADGDLRVWSISKPPSADIPKVIRILKRGDNIEAGLNWICWSKNGRIIQFSQGETWAWDVRTKHVAYEPVPTIDGVKALACFGPTAALFTLGPNNTVQQYELSPPALLRNVRHEPIVTVQAPPPSNQSTPKMQSHQIPGAAPPQQLFKELPKQITATSFSTIQNATNEMLSIEHARQMRNGMGSPLSTTSRTESISSRSSAGNNRYRAPSVSSRAASGTTFSTLSPSVYGRESMASPFNFPRTASVVSSHRSRGSRLRQEVLLSPENQIVDLFPYARARLASLPYNTQPSQQLDQATACASDLRRQMLQVVFGWEGDIEEMIRDELSHHEPGSLNATLLSKWLGENNIDPLTAMTNASGISSTDWMMLALSQMNGQGAAGQQIGRAFAQKLLHQGDIHTAATIYLGIGDHDDAVDIYISRNYFMEGILLTCLLFPDEWQRQAHLVRRWGEFVVENSQQHLAVRCFACTGVDTQMAWAQATSPPSQSGMFGSIQQQSSFKGSSAQGVPHNMISPPTSPPPDQLKAQRMLPRDSGLKLITSFGQSQKSQYSFPGLKPEDATPTIAPGVTPIADSALTPGGTPSSYMRPQLRSRNHPRTPGGYDRHRLPSIGETPIEVVAPPFPSGNSISTSNGSGSEKEKEAVIGRSSIIAQKAKAPPGLIDDAPLTLSSARYDPSEGTQTPGGATPQTALPTTAVKTNMSASEKFAAAQERSRTRNGSRDRKPDGLHIRMPSLNQLNLNAIALNGSLDSAKSDPTKRRSNANSLSSSGASGRFDPRFDTLSPGPITGQSFASSTKSPSVSGRSVDQYISSLEEAQFYAAKKKESHRSRRDREDRSENKSRSRTRQRIPEDDRGRGSSRYIRPAKRSPSSPVPMSPQDLEAYRNTNTQSIDSTASRDSSPEAPPRSRGQTPKRKGVSKGRSTSKMSDLSHRTVRRHSPISRYGTEDDSRDRHRSQHRRPTPDELLSPNGGRGRSKSKMGSSLRSPSSPLPMSPQVKLYKNDEDIDEDPLRLVEANRQRLRSSHRSTSRQPRSRGTSAMREKSSDRRFMPEQPPMLSAQTSEVTQDSGTDQKPSDGEKVASDSNVHPLMRIKSHRTLKKELAARELEARRESLTAKSMAHVTLPSSIGRMDRRPSLGARSQTDLGNSPLSSSWSRFGSPPTQHGFSDHSTSNSDFSPIDRSISASAGPYGLPSTPRAMRHPRYPSRDEEIPAVPELPDSFYATGQPMRELPRSMSAPIPEPEMPILPNDLPIHPAFHRGLRPSLNQGHQKRPSFAPLNEIGSSSHKQRRPSLDAGQGGLPMIGSLDAALNAIPESHGPIIIAVPDSEAHLNANYVENPPIIPELQHLANHNMPPPPPPPTPPPPKPFAMENPHHSLSSGSGVGTINILMEDSREGTPMVIDVNASTNRIGSPPTWPPSLNSASSRNSPPRAEPYSRSASTVNESSGTDSAGKDAGGRGHRRGRSVQLGSKIKGFTERMRSASRGRDNAKSPQIGVVPSVPSPYETNVGLQPVQVAGTGQYF